MHVGGVLIFEGPPPAFDDFLDHIRGAAAPRAALPPEARAPAARDRPADVGRRPDFNLEYHVRHTALPAPGTEEQLLAAGRAHRLAAARPREAAVGDVARRGPRGRPLRADLQDPPRAGRRHLRRRPGDRAVRPRARSRRAAARPEQPWRPQPEPSPPSSSLAGVRGRGQRAGVDWPSARGRRRAPGRRARSSGARGRRGHRRDRVGGAEPGARDAAERRRSARTAASPVVRQRAGGLQGRSRTRSAAPSTTSCWPSSSGALRAAGCARAACAPRASSCARSCRCRSAPRTSAATLGNRSTVMRGPLPVYIEDPVARLRFVAPRDGRPQGVQAGGRREATLAASTTSRRRRSSPRRRD